MTMSGYDAVSGKMTDVNGGITLVNADLEIAASWSFKGMMAHWNRKHAKAAYVPSLFRTPPPEYRYGGQVLMCEQTDFLRFLKSFAAGKIYYDPGIKIEEATSSRPRTKQRSQFRVAHGDLIDLYERHDVVKHLVQL